LFERVAGVCIVADHPIADLQIDYVSASFDDFADKIGSDDIERVFSRARAGGENQGLIPVVARKRPNADDNVRPVLFGRSVESGRLCRHDSAGNGYLMDVNGFGSRVGRSLLSKLAGQDSQVPHLVSLIS